MPPTGHVAGIFARTDIERGVHKAPANEVVAGRRRPEPSSCRSPKGEQDILNPRGVNCIRDFRTDGRGIRVWGARTMSSDPEWKYVNVRRLFIFVEESIDEGTQWVVFEPNDEPLWAQVRRSIDELPARVWRSGALMGTTQEEAFFVKCDRTTMTQDDIDNGRLICYIGIAPVKPAEFVIFRISQKTAGGSGARRFGQGGETMPADWQPRNDPFSAFNFLVEIDGVTVGRFLGVQRPVDRDRRHRVPHGRRGHHRAQAARAEEVQQHHPEARLHQTTRNSGSGARRSLDGKTERQSGTITLLDEARKPALRWTFREGWPRKWTVRRSTPRPTRSPSRRSSSHHEGLVLE